MNETILVVEDDEQWAFIAKTLLEKEFNVIHVRDRDTCVKRMEEGDIRFVLLDLGLPDVQGFELLHQIKSLEPTLPVMIWTCQNEVRTAVEAIISGADDYLIKQESEDGLATLIRKNIRPKRRNISVEARTNKHQPDILIPDHPMYRRVFKQTIIDDHIG